MSDGTRSFVELVIVGVVSGAGGALITSLLRIRADREQQLRERMIIAADDLVTGFVQTYMPIRRFINAHNEGDSAAAQQQVQEMRDLTDEVVARLARVELLFGRGTRASSEASKMVACLSQGLIEAEEYPNADMVTVRDAFAEASDHQGEFVRFAYEAVTKRRLRQPEQPTESPMTAL
jgi:hypothetical protein